MVGAGKIGVGIFLVLLGFVSAAVGMFINGIQSNNVQQCNSLGGGLGQLLDSRNAELCNKAPAYQSVSTIGIFFGIVILSIGMVLIILGAIDKHKHTSTETRKRIVY